MTRRGERIASRVGADRGWGPGVPALCACFFLSGATALCYQVVWLRMLGLIFGHTVHAITTVLAAFMAGLAMGSFIMGRQARRVRDPIAMYGWLEIAIGIYAGMMPALFGLVSSLYLQLGRALGVASATFAAVQFLIVFLLLFVPTALMGATLPVLSQALVRSKASLGRTVATLYAVNTFGAVVGVAAAGYGLLPAVGNRITITTAAGANVAVGLLALLYVRRRLRIDSEAPTRPAPSPALRVATVPGGAGVANWPIRVTVAALGVSGAASMLYEVTWTRALALVIGSSTYAFTAMLLAVLLGIAGGSALYAWLWGGRPASPGMLAALQAGIGVTVTVVVLLFERMPELFLIALAWSAAPAFVQMLQVAVSVGVLLLPSLQVGATFPCALAVASRGVERVGADVGWIYAVNTLGAIVGVMLTGFVLIPVLGVHASIRLGIATNLLLAVALLVAAPHPSAVGWWGAVGGALCLAGAVAFIRPWDPTIMASGPAIYGTGALRWTGRERFAQAVRATSVIYYRDGLSGTVSVHRAGERLFLRINGKTDAGTGGDMQTQVVLGHLPLLAHPDPRRVLVIGLGSGITAGAVARHPVERLDVVEIEPAVLAASRFFASLNGDVLQDPRVRTVLADGRNLLVTGSDRYDVIVSEPSNPWISGLASLFSVEFFRLARSRLQPGGIMMQWVQAYDLLPDDLRMVVNTFRTVFPHTTVWGAVGDDLLLLGRVEPAAVDLRLIRSRYESNARLRQDLERVGLRTWSNILGLFRLNEQDTARLAAGAGLNTDDRLPLEFSAPRALYLNTTALNRELVRSFRTAAVPEVTPESRPELARADVRFGIAMGHYGQNALQDALSELGQALALDAQYVPALFWAGAISLRLGRPAEALPLLRRVHDLDPRNAQALLLAGMAALTLGVPREAIEFLDRGAALEPGNEEIRKALQQARAAAARHGP